ncbi:MAG: sensor histidine kinase [Saprospiraceae bacterium]
MHELKTHLKVGVLSFLIAGAVNTIFSLLFDDNFPLKEAIIDFLYSGIMTAFIWIGNGVIAEKLPISWVEQPLKRLFVSLVLTVVYTLGIVMVIHIAMNFILFGHSPATSFQFLRSGFITSVLVVTFLISLFLHGRAFLFHWKNAILETERLKQAHLSSRFESLKNQVNPHFLFNSLNVLSGLVYKDADLAAQFIKHLADVYRYVLDTRDRELVSLETELNALHAYLFLLQIRFGDNLKVEIHLPDVKATMIPPLTLQMLVENAIKHNIVSRQQPLHIHIIEVNNHIIVKNNLQIKHHPQESNGIGLANIQERYRYITDQSVQINQDEQSFNVSVPLIPMAS